MTGTVLLLDLAGWVALLLWGIHMIRTGIQRAYGPDLRRWLGSNLNHPIKALFAGLGVTLLLQSSTATGLMATAFAAGGLVELVPALAVMLGANVGTALIVKALSFDTAKAAPVLVLLGAVTFRRAGGAKGRALGRVAIGLGLVLISLHQLVATIAPYGNAPGTQAVLGILVADPVIALLVAAFLAWAAHSSVAVVLLVAAFAQQGVVSLDAALALVLGANLGSALNPLIASREPAGRRVALGNVLVRLVGCVVALPLIGTIRPGLEWLAGAPWGAVADFHLLFNAVLAVVALPLLGLLVRLLRRLLPEHAASGVEPALRLDEGLLEMPSVALGLASRHALRMADILDGMLREAVLLLREGTGDPERVKLAEQELERRGGEVQVFLAGFDADALAEAEERRLASLVSFTIQIGHAADVLARNVVGQVGRRRKLGAGRASAASIDLAGLLERLSANLRTAASLLVTEDEVAARRLADEKSGFRDVEERRIEAHVALLRGDPAHDATLWAIDLDLVRDLKRINDHLVASAAYPILRNSGALLDSRLRIAPPTGQAANGPGAPPQEPRVAGARP